MPFDNQAFTAWLQEFEKTLIDCGMPERQALRYRSEYYDDALGYFAAGTTPGDAATTELLG